ncbi:hypothetical protein RB195_011934 [Necator americanus]
MENNPALVPDEVQQLMFGLSTQSKRQIVTLVNDVAAGRLILPKDPHQIGSVIAGRVPEVANRFPQALATIRKNQACMSQDTRDEIKQWYLRAAAILAGPRQRLVSGTAAWIADIKDAFDDADDSIKEDVQQCEPAAYRLLESGIITNFAHGARIFSDSVRPIANIGNPENDNKGNPEPENNGNPEPENKGNPEPENKGNPENPEITDATTCAQESTT